MAQRRMINVNIVESDEFLDCSHNARSLYLYLMMKADDDGFINNLRALFRMYESNLDDFKELVNAGLVISFDEKNCVIVHWKQQNKIAKDRYKPTNNQYKDSVKLDNNLMYAECLHNDNNKNTECLQDDDNKHTECQPSIVKSSKVEYSSVKVSKVKDSIDCSNDLSNDKDSLFGSFSQIDGKNDDENLQPKFKPVDTSDMIYTGTPEEQEQFNKQMELQQRINSLTPEEQWRYAKGELLIE